MSWLTEMMNEKRAYAEYVLLCENYGHTPTPFNHPWASNYQKLLMIHQEIEFHSTEYEED